LGHTVTDRGIRTDAEKVTAISDLTTPRTTKEVNSFLGMASWYRKFIPEFTEQASKRKRSNIKLGNKKQPDDSTGTSMSGLHKTVKIKNRCKRTRNKSSTDLRRRGR